MFTEPDTISLFCLLMYIYMYLLFILLPTLSLLCMFQSYNNKKFSVDIILLFYMTEHNYSVFCDQKQGSIKNVNANLSGNSYGTTYFFPRSLRSLGI